MCFKRALPGLNETTSADALVLVKRCRITTWEMIQLFRCDEDTAALAAETGLLNSSLLSSEVIVSYDQKK